MTATVVEARRLAAKRRGLAWRLRSVSGPIHVWQLFAGQVSEGQDALGGIAEWLRERLG